MPTVSLQEALSVKDILDTSNYRFSLGSIPGNGIDRNMEIQCTQAIYPGSQNEVFMQAFPGGHELSYRGRKIFPKTISLTYAESAFMNVTQAFGNWLNFIADTDTGLSEGKKDRYAINGTLDIYDLIGHTIDTIRFFNLQINDRPDITFDAANSAACVVTVTLTYDYFYSTMYGPSTNANVVPASVLTGAPAGRAGTPGALTA